MHIVDVDSIYARVYFVKYENERYHVGYNGSKYL